MVMKYSCSPSLADFRLHPHSSAKQRLLLPVHQLLVTGMLVGEIGICRSNDVNICVKNMLLMWYGDIGIYPSPEDIYPSLEVFLF